MKHSLKYLIKTELDEQLDSLFGISLLLFSKFDGKICPICEIKQGSKFLGWEKYYCSHTEQEVNKRMRKKQKKLVNQICLFAEQSTEKRRKK